MDGVTDGCPGMAPGQVDTSRMAEACHPLASTMDRAATNGLTALRRASAHVLDEAFVELVGHVES